MSHHLDSALSRRDARLNVADLYVFRGDVGTVLVLDVNTSAAGSLAKPGFHPEARYELNIDLDGDAIEDLAFRLTFGEFDDSGGQTLDVYALRGWEARGDSASAELIARGPTETELSASGDVRVWAGRAADPFYVDAAVLRAVTTAFKRGTRLDMRTWDAANASNVFQGTQVNAVVLEVPDTYLDGALTRSRRVGVWGVTRVRTQGGRWQQVNRAGRPMMQCIFNPDGGESGGLFNTTEPREDWANYAHRFTDQITAVVAAHNTAHDARAYAESVVARLLPDVLPYEIGTPASFGFAVHNGRMLDDNAPEVMFSLVTNSGVSVGLDRQSATRASGHEFPYVAMHI